MTTFIANRTRALGSALGISLVMALSFASAHAAQATDGGGTQAAHAAGKAYHCDLRRSAQVCREFSVVADHERRVRMLADGCASMGGTFGAGASCPQQGRVARCVDVVPDPNHLDRLRHTYDVHYYADPEARDTQDGWNVRTVRRVCDNLMGDYTPE